ncbi:MAG: hypothetical protein ABR521_01460 [Gaiellaceae bacterium]
MKTCLAIMAAAALALPQLAPAKEITSLQVCGASGCAAVAKAKAKDFYSDGGEQAPEARVPAVGAYYVVKVGFGDGTRTLATHRVYVPASGLGLKADGPWTALTAAQRAALDSVDVEPFPAPRLQRVEIAGRVSADPNAYLGVIGRSQTQIPKAVGSPLQVTFHWRGSQHPWAEIGYLNYLPRADVLFGPVGWVDVSGELATRLEREAAGLSPLPPGSGFPWRPMSLAAGGLAFGLTGLAWLLRSRRRRQALPRREPTPA